MLDIIVAWGTVVGVILSASYKYDQVCADEEKRKTATIVKGTLGAESYDWYTRVNNRFLEIFDSILGFRELTRERLTWFGIILTYWIFLTLRFSAELFRTEIPDPPFLLFIALGISAVTVLGVAGIFGNTAVLGWLHDKDKYIPRTASTTRDFWVRGIVGAVLLAALSIGLFYSLNAPDIPLVLAVAITFPVLGLEFILFANQKRGDPPIQPTTGELSKLVCSILIILTIVVYNLLIWGLSIGTNSPTQFITTLGAITFLVPLGVYAIFQIPTEWFHANPLRAILVSIVTVSFASVFLFPQARTTFFEALGSEGIILVSFLAFNMFADTISLQETEWILRQSLRVPKKVLLLVLVADLGLSAGIYLILPIFVGQPMDEFIMGIQFAGPSPWIGILFWSTFITSLIFYVFVISVFVINSGIIMGRLPTTGIDYDEHPMTAIGFTASILVTILGLVFWIYRDLIILQF